MTDVSDAAPGGAVPGQVKPGVAEPDRTERDRSEPDPTAPDPTGPDRSERDVDEPGQTEPDADVPEVAEPDVAKPDVAKPDLAEPDVAEPDVAKPDLAEPDLAEPDVAEPDVAEPDQTAPDQTAPDAAAPEPEPERPGPAEPQVAPTPVRRHRVLVFLAALTGLVAVVCGALLPFAPVSVNQPTVTWPQEPTRPESTLLQLAAHRPLVMDIRFSCEAASLAQERGGVVVSTAAPDSPVAGTTGLIVTARDGRLRVAALDELLLDEPLAPGPCEYRITGQSRGLPVYQGELPDPTDPAAPDLSALAGPDNARLVVARDGAELLRRDARQLPDVEVLATSLTEVPAGGLAVALRVDDEFTGTATPAKQALVLGLLAALLLTALLLVLLDRRTPRVPAIWRPGRPRLVDLLVPAVLVLWMFIAPATDDDGYYAAMARNAALTGDVGNYFQLYDQSFTPFTWFYQALGWWQQLVGDAVVLQRIPALVFGVLTFYALRRFTVAAMHEWAPDRRWVRVLAHALLAITFLVWWVPQDMGVRPETVVALTGSWTLLAVLAAGRRNRLGLAWLAFLVAGVGFTTHPTGFTLFAPLVAGLPLLWPVVRVAGDHLGTALRAFAVASGGMIAMATAFADGALRDFLRGQAIFLSIQSQEGWTSEIQRYGFLLTANPMGNFAKRSAILVCLVALVWFAVLAVAARVRGVAVPTALWFAASTTALAFASLWLTPSKWSHHFGALAGFGPVFLALLLVTAVPLTLRVLGDARPPLGVLAAATTSFAVAIALAWHGPNRWPYSRLDGAQWSDDPSTALGIALDSPALWVLVVAVVAVVGWGIGRRAGHGFRSAWLRAVPVVVVLSLAGTTWFTVATFAQAAMEDVPVDSVWARSWADPTGTGCGAAGVVRVYDPTTAVPLAAASPPPAPTTPQSPTTTAAPPAPRAPGRAPAPPQPTPVTPENPAYTEYFLSDSGYYVGNAPQGPGAAQVWGSMLGRDGLAFERNTGQMSTGWYALPPTPTPDSAVTVLAAGTLADGNSLTAFYARADGATVAPVEVEDGPGQELTDTARDPSWRTFVLTPPPGAELVRLAAVDGTGGVHGWVGFSAPALSRAKVLDEYIPSGSPVALAWPIAFNYPCVTQPAMVDGITESPEHAVLWGDEALSGFGDGAWQSSRGGAFAQVPRTQSVQQLAVVPGTDPRIEVYTFATPLAPRAYTVTRTARETPGGSAAIPDLSPEGS
ncbi:arabinosyltransferase domain-containing protein [Pseudonocardia humida]|uniref:Arabinosyltransferase domain-containing protein n=1 Tax=Pseudonocardia humida TaxID=2800819 RepID=A0ABT1A4H0_9PSEU|nr:arabinosyltransferase domain-containing protein [Pseudonocardia humida]MCO1657909.1 arabinosyltransferase domain-containing protein [Pseudonocardia humida]